MWWSNRVYFVSDRDGIMNVWSMAEDGSALRQHTTHADFDVKQPALSNGRIAYQVGADLWLYDIAADSSRPISITLASDLDQLRERWVNDPMQYLTAAHLSRTGAAVVLTARGRVFVSPAEQGRLVQASRTTGVRYRDVVFMPDGNRLLGLSDASGELEFDLLPVDGVGDAEPLTANGSILRFQGHPSPDGRWVAYTDNNRDLWLLNVDTRSQRVVSSNHEGATDIAWSPNSQWLTYSQTEANSFQRVILHNVERDASTPLTSDRVNSTSASWSADGEWIYFLSDRNLRSVVGTPWGPRQPEPYFDKPMKMYQVAVRLGTRSPFKPADELAEANSPADAQSVDDLTSSETVADVPVDLDGIEQRVTELPIPPGNYRTLVANATTLFWVARDPGASPRSHLMAVSIGARLDEPVTVVSDIRSFELSGDGSKAMVRKGNALHVFEAAPKAPADLAKTRVDLSGWSFPVDVREDWRQIFIDAWRLERDYFYDPNMHGLDWIGVRDKYLPLVERVTTRGELSDVIGRVIGELSALHTSVRGGDLRRGPDSVDLASFGARLTRDEAAGGYRVDYIYQGDPDYPAELSPLANPELDVAAGDTILAVNGVDVLSAVQPDALLRNQADQQVLVRLRSARTGNERDVIVRPTSQGANLRYADWEVTRRQRVEARGAGTLGYVHLRAMGGNDLTAWYRQFYPVFNRQGLVLDMRRNRGGNIDSFILEKLMRRAWSYWKNRNREPYWNMQFAFRGHMVVLVDQNTASDGESFADGFRRLGLGKVIGMRTWGGEIWLSSANRLSDAGLARAPMMGVYGPEGEWLVEGHGVDPDIVVDNLPHATFNGEDAQLDAAIAYLLAEIEKDPRLVPAPPPFPDKSFRPSTSTADLRR